MHCYLDHHWLTFCRSYVAVISSGCSISATLNFFSHLPVGIFTLLCVTFLFSFSWCMSNCFHWPFYLEPLFALTFYMSHVSSLVALKSKCLLVLEKKRKKNMDWCKMPGYRKWKESSELIHMKSHTRTYTHTNTHTFSTQN